MRNASRWERQKCHERKGMTFLYRQAVGVFFQSVLHVTELWPEALDALLQLELFLLAALQLWHFLIQLALHTVELQKHIKLWVFVQLWPTVVLIWKEGICSSSMSESLPGNTLEGKIVQFSNFFVGIRSFFHPPSIRSRSSLISSYCLPESFNTFRYKE